MIRDDILHFLQRYEGQYTATQIAMKIDSSNSRVYALLRDLWKEGIVSCQEVEEQGVYGARVYLLWELN